MMPVPIENRIEAISTFVIASVKIHTERQIAAKLNISEGRVRTLARAIGLIPIASSDDVVEYPLYTYELLEEELAWAATIESLEEYVSAGVIAKTLARDEHWVKHKTNELAIFPEPRPTRLGKHAFAYPKSVIAQLRHIMLHTPYAGTWSSMSELEEEVGRGRAWIKKRLDAAGIYPEERMARGNHAVIDHYSPEALEYLRVQKERQPAPAGEWRTIRAMALVMGRDEHWVRARIDQYEQLGRQKLDDNGKPAFHYPPAVLDALQQENNEIQAYPEAEQYVSTKTLMQKLGRSALWVRNRIEKIEAQAEMRRNKSGRVYAYDSPQVLKTLQELNEQERAKN
jgi:hypothetical protein